MAGKGRKRSKPKHPVGFKRKALRFVVHLFGWIGVAVVYYFAFSFFFDTPIEYGMKRSVVRMEDEYGKLSDRYDTISRVLENLRARDRHLFYTLFESYPLEDYDTEESNSRYDSLLNKTNRRMGEEFLFRLSVVKERKHLLDENFSTLMKRIGQREMELNHTPSIQPVLNRELSLIGTSFGMRIHPFLKRLGQHNGMDYVVGEGSAVFATADGTVAKASQSAATGLSLVISHGNGYETHYNHLSRALVKESSKVKRGDIIALTGNSGLSLAPHLHYEIRYKGVSIDPVNYFFMELSPQEYEKVKKLAAVGMQSFD